MSRSVIVGAATLLIAVTGCTAASDQTTTGSATTPTTTTSGASTSVATTAATDPVTTQPMTSTPATDPTSPIKTSAVSDPAPNSAPATSARPPDAIVGTIVRFSGPTATVHVTIVEDNATVRSLLSLLPLTVEFEDFNGREKIGYPPDELDVVESGHDSENNDLIYYVPWGNLGFYYNATGIGFDTNVVRIGRYDSTPDQLVGLEGIVSISIVTD